MKKKTSEIVAQDVLQVAKDLRIELTDVEVQQVLEQYDDEVNNDKTATWDLIIENIIYNIVINNLKK